ncbi:FadR/GntR family transcriptional regulator [Thermodesulfobacteriota bacterium]
MKSFKPIKQARVSEEVFLQLKQAILSNDFKAGDKMPAELALAEQFQVSRLAIKEALRALENAGFIEIRQGSSGGAYVTDLTFETLACASIDLFLANKISIPELSQVRILIEPEVARLATLNADPEGIQRLENAFDSEHPPGASLTEDIASATTVHYILAEMCGNRFLEALVNSLINMSALILEEIKPNPPSSIHPPGSHKFIVEAVLKRDPDAAAEAMRNHAVGFYENLVKLENDYRKQAGKGGEDKTIKPYPPRFKLIKQND